MTEEPLDRWTLVKDGAVAIDHGDDVGRTLDERSKAAFILAKGLLRAVARGPLPSFTQLSVDGRDETRRAPLHDVVVRSGFHRLHGRTFADRPGENDERNVQSFLMKEVQGLNGAEVRKRIVGDDEIPRLLIEQTAHLLGSLHSCGGGLVAAARQLSNEEFSVILRVFDDERAKSAP